MKNTVALSVVVTFLLAACGCATKQGDVAKGNKLFDAGKYSEASLKYRKAIQKDPQYGEAYYRMGLSAIKQDHAAEAYEALFHAFQFLPNSVEVKEKFAEVCLAFYLGDTRHPQNYYQLLSQISGDLLRNNPKSYEAFRIKAYLAATDRKTEEAVALFRQALQIDASDPGMTAALIQNLFRNGQSQEAEKLALDMTKRQKSYGPIYDLLYDRYSATNRSADAENILKAKTNNNPKNADYVFELATYYARLQKQVEMKASLQRLLDDPSDFPQAHLLVGDFYVRLRDYQEAIREYQKGDQNSSKDKTVYQKRITNVLLSQGKEGEAFQLVEQILKEDANDRDARKVRAELLLRTSNPNSVDAAEREFLALSKETPGDAVVWFRLGEANRLKGDLGAAREHYLEAIRRRQDYLAPRYALAEIGMLSQQPDQTLRQANEILKLSPDDNQARLFHARGLTGTNDLSGARAELTTLIKASPQDSEPQLQLGLVALAEHKYREAESLFTRLQSTGDPRAVAGLAETYLAQRQFQKAFQVLADGLKKSPDSALIGEQFARVATLTGQYDPAVTELRKLISTDPRSIEKRLRLGEVYEIKGETNEAILAYQKAEELSPSDLQAELALAEAFAKAGHASEAKAEYEKLIRSHPDNPGALNNAAFFLSENGGNLDEALQLARRALEKAPGQPGFLDTIGYIYLKKGQRDSAIQTFTNLARNYPGRATFRYHLGLALFENGDKASARKELKAALANHPLQQDAKRIQALLDKIS